jgi:hypothetical protein
VERESAQILADGLPALRPAPRPDGVPAALAAWQGAGYGAVLWLRWLRNGEFDAECVVLRQDRLGEWIDYATSSSSGGWYPCVDEEAAGWRRLDEDPGQAWITWCDDGTTPVDGPEAGGDSVLRIASGFVVPAIAALRVESATVESYLVRAHPVTGAVLLGMIGPDSPRVVPLDAAGAELRGPGGPIALADLAALPEGLVPCGAHSSYVGELRNSFGPEACAHPDVAASPEEALDRHLGGRPGGSQRLRFTRAGTEPAAVTFHGRTDDGVVHAVVTAEQVGGPHRWLVSFVRECVG